MAAPTSRLPWLKFYPADFQSDPALRLCSLAARGLCIEMICLMHGGTPYGYMTANARAITAEKLAVIVGAPVLEVKELMAQLRANGVFCENSSGVIFSRRMVADKKARDLAVKNGRNGGNPKIIRKKQKNFEPDGVNPSLNHEDKVEDNRGDKERVKLEGEGEGEPDSFSSHSARPTKARLDQGTRLPDEWQPSEADRQYAAKLNLDAGWVTEGFRNYWLAKPGKEARKTNWSLTWNNWCRIEAEKHRKRPAGTLPDVRSSMSSCL